MKAVILNTDNSVMTQALNHHFDVGSVELVDIRMHLQFYADARGRVIFSERIKLWKQDDPVLHLLGSGDFHHLTLMILEQISTPFLLVVFDNHIDCSFIGPKYHCGNWLYHAGRLPACRMILHSGATEQYGPLRRFMGVTRLMKKEKLVQLPGTRLTGPDSIHQFIEELSCHNANRLPVYVSVDKDVLNREESPGDWNNGIMSMTLLGKMLDHIVRTYDVIGADITGESGGMIYYRYKPVKNILSWIEHRNCETSTSLISALVKQRSANFELLRVMGVRHLG